jgi:D-aminopeptidase
MAEVAGARERRMSVTAGGRPRARDLGIRLGTLEPGPYNAITDVGDVRVGHVTIIDEGDASPPRGPARTGVTVVLPHGGNLFQQKVPAACHVINAFGKAVGVTQLQELGVLETPVALTNTLSVGSAFEGLVLHALAANPEIGRSAGNVNPVVAECSDARLNDIQALVVRPEHVLEAVAAARPGPVAEGSVGAGTGMICYGWKGGIGTASRTTGSDAGSHVVGVLVLANFGQPGDLRVDGVPVGESLRPPGSWAPPVPPAQDAAPAQDAGGSCVVVLATTAPADSRQLGRLARRVQNGLAWTGTFGEHGSGEYVIAFSTARLIPHVPGAELLSAPVLPEDGPLMDKLFRAVAESVEEAVVNALLGAGSVTSGPVLGSAAPVAGSVTSGPVLGSAAPVAGPAAAGLIAESAAARRQVTDATAAGSAAAGLVGVPLPAGRLAELLARRGGKA